MRKTIAAAIWLAAAAPAEALPPAELHLGQVALSQARYPLAYTLCGQATRRPQHRLAALLCQGGAALGLDRPKDAEALARAALRVRPTLDGHLLLAEALHLQRRCAEALPHYLHVLEMEETNPAAVAGAAACAAPPDRPETPPPGASRLALLTAEGAGR